MTTKRNRSKRSTRRVATGPCHHLPRRRERACALCSGARRLALRRGRTEKNITINFFDKRAHAANSAPARLSVFRGCDARRHCAARVPDKWANDPRMDSPVASAMDARKSSAGSAIRLTAGVTVKVEDDRRDLTKRRSPADPPDPTRPPSMARDVSRSAIRRRPSERFASARFVAPSSSQRVEQNFGLLQVERVEPFGEPAVDRREEIAGRVPLALVAPQPRQAGRRAQFP
jgi:hypothetical protein